jgi:peptidyl-prolyl cis-trans isomerase A (cyclophilin A)
MKRTISLLALLATTACEPQTPKQQPKPTPTNNTPTTPPITPKQANPNQDPENGDFTLEEALTGLSGSGTLTAKLSTSMGEISCTLHPEIAPNSVANFVGLARGTRPFYDLTTGTWNKRPFYDGLTFHRVIPNFMIQTGDPRGTGREGPGYKIKDEFTDKILFDAPGRLAMARPPRPNSAGSQFFITEAPYPSLNKQYTIFGQCQNIEIVKQIARVETTPTDPSRPATPVTLEKVEIFYQAK